MTNAVVPISKIKQALARAETPQETKNIEAMAQAARAWAKEQGDYELTVEAMHTWILARRKTTELIKPYIVHGGNGSNQYVSKGSTDLTLADFNITKATWYNRVKELQISDEELNAYFDECIAKQWEPTLFGLKLWTSNGAHVSYNSGENEWYTPPEYIAAAVDVLGEIDLDPASSDKANDVIRAKRYYTKENSGLDEGNEWGGRVWMNPPYASGLIEKFIARYALEVRLLTVTEGIVLVNNATETDWFGQLVSVSDAVVFTDHRVRFLDKHGNPGAPLQGQAILYHGAHVKKFLERFAVFGWGARL